MHTQYLLNFPVSTRLHFFTFLTHILSQFGGPRRQSRRFEMNERVASLEPPRLSHGTTLNQAESFTLKVKTPRYTSK